MAFYIGFLYPATKVWQGIDLIFTNFPEDMEVRAGTLPVYYSDHMIIWAAIKS